MQSAAVRQRNTIVFKSLKRRNPLFIVQNRAIKTYYCENRTKNKK